MMAGARPRTRPDLTIVELDGEAVIYDDDAGELHHLNQTATVAFSLFDGTATLEELAQELGDAYGLSSEEIGPHLDEIVSRFAEAGLLVSEGLDDERSHR